MRYLPSCVCHKQEGGLDDGFIISPLSSLSSSSSPSRNYPCNGGNGVARLREVSRSGWKVITSGSQGKDLSTTTCVFSLTGLKGWSLKKQGLGHGWMEIKNIFLSSRFFGFILSPTDVDVIYNISLSYRSPMPSSFMVFAITPPLYLSIPQCLPHYMLSWVDQILIMQPRLLTCNAYSLGRTDLAWSRSPAILFLVCLEHICIVIGIQDINLC